MEELVDRLIQQPIVLVAFGLGLAMIVGIRYLGLKAGERSQSREGQAAQVAAVIVDPTAMVSAKVAVIALTKTLSEGQSLEKDHVHMTCRRIENLTSAVESLTSAMTEIRVALLARR